MVKMSNSTLAKVSRPSTKRPVTRLSNAQLRPAQRRALPNYVRSLIASEPHVPVDGSKIVDIQPDPALLLPGDAVDFYNQPLPQEDFMIMEDFEDPLVPPTFNPKRPVLKQVDGIDFSVYTKSSLLGAGWPPSLVDKVMQGRFYDRTVAMSKRVFSGKVGHRSVGAHAFLWKVPEHPAPRRPRPVVYARSSFRAWIVGEAFAMSRGLPKTKVVVGNFASQALYYGAEAASDPAIAHMLTMAGVFVYDYRETDKTPSGTRLGHFILSPFVAVMVCGVPCYSLSEFRALEEVINHKLFFRMGVDYFERPSTSKWTDLQSIFDRFYPAPPVSAPVARDVRLALEMFAAEFTLPPLRGSWVKPLDMGKLTYQGWLDSTHSVVTHHTVDLGFKFNPGRMVRLVALVTGFFTSTSWVNALSLLTIYASDEPIYPWLEKSFGRLKNLVVLQGAGFLAGISDAAFKLVCEVMAASGLSSIFGWFGESVSSALIPLLTDVVATVKFSIKREGAVAVAKSFLEWFHSLVSRIVQCCRDGDLAALWGPRWDHAAWVAESKAMVQYYTVLTCNASASPGVAAELTKLRLSGALSARWVLPVTVPDFVTLCEEHLEDGKRLAQYFVSKPLISRSIKEGADGLRSLLTMLNISRAGQAARVVPIMLYIVGPPGTGKTNIARQLITSVAQAHGLDNTSSGVYDWQPAVNFQDGLLHTHWAIIMDDVDSGAGLPAAGTRSVPEEIIALVNNKVYPVEQADVALKGRVRAAPLLIAYCTNLENGRAPEMLMDPGAFYRRISLHVRVESKLPGGRITVDSALASDTHRMFKMKLSHTVPRESKDTSRLIKIEEVPGFVDLPELAVKVRELFAANLTKQTRYLNQVSSSGYCYRCGLSTSKKCDCPPPGVERDADEEKTEEPLGKVSLQARFNCHSWTLAFFFASIKAEEESIKRALLTVAAVGTAILTAAYVLKTSVVTTLEGAVREIVPLPEGWHRSNMVSTPGVPFAPKNATFTKDEAIADIKEHSALFEGFTADGRVQVMWALILSSDTILVPTHAFDGCVRFTVKSGSRLGEFDFQPSLLVTVSHELSVYRAHLRGVRGLAKKFWSCIDTATSSFEKVVVIGADKEYSVTSNRVATQGGARVLTTNAPTQQGDCGMVYLALVGKTWQIVAVHYAVKTSSNALGETVVTLGSMLSQIDIARAMASLTVMDSGMVTVQSTVTRCPEGVSMWPEGPRSETWASQRDGGIDLLGHIEPPVHGSTYKTKVEPSILTPHLSEFIREAGCEGYWQIPTFKGRMQDGRWVSPFTNMFSTLNTKIPDELCMRLALADVLQGVLGLNRDGYSVLSEDQSLRGIPGTYINSINLKTSAGPPFNSNKRGFVHLDGDESSMDPKIWEMCDEIEEILQAGDVPSVLGLCTLKDEPLKPGKMPRVFICLPMAMNLVAKKYGSAWKSFTRANLQFFESCVGINMTSTDSNKVISILRSIDPGLTRVYDGDIKAMDKSWSPTLWHFVSLLIYGISWAIGVAPKINYLIAKGFHQVLYCCKNDLFRAFFNPSGGDSTVELNGLALSLGERYVYYRTQGFRGDPAEVNRWFASFFENPVPEFPGLTFRDNVALVHYGDDNLKTMRHHPGPDYLRVWEEELGMVMTPADKSLKELVGRGISEVSFLKRTFVFDDELGFYLPRLDKRSIVRMLTMKNSGMSAQDHACCVLNDAQREMVYYGPDEFESFMAMARAAVDVLGLTGNGYLRFEPYAHWRAQIAENAFITWAPRELRLPVLEDGDFLIRKQ